MKVLKDCKRLIVFEGTDGIGKSSAMLGVYNSLCKIIDQNNIVVIREPGGSPAGEAIRDLVHNYDVCDKALALLVAASRAELVDKIINPSLEEGKIILCDRNFTSSLVYQGLQKNCLDEVIQINDYAIKNAMPGLTLMFDIPIDILEKRISERKGNTKFDTMFDPRRTIKDYRSVRWIKLFENEKIIQIEADKSKKEVIEQCMKAIHKHLEF